MKIKYLIIVGLLGGFVGWTSCANQSEGFYIAKFYPLGAGCDHSAYVSSSIAGNGYLDVAAANPQFFVGLRIIGGDKIVQPTIKVGEAVLENENRNRPIVTQQVVNYRLSKRVGAAPKPYITNITIPFSDNGEIVGAFQLISPDLGAQLYDGLAPSPGVAPSSVIEDFVDINVDVEFKGEFSASRSTFTTGTLTFPIRAYRSNPTACTNGFQPMTTATAAADGGVEFVVDPCQYVGQSFSQLVQPAPPSACCLQPGC